MTKFDLLRVSYIDKDGEGLCMAPCYQIKEGDTVETPEGRAFVLKREGYCAEDEPLWQMINGLVSVSKVLFKLTPVRFEDDSD